MVQPGGPWLSGLIQHLGRSPRSQSPESSSSLLLHWEPETHKTQMEFWAQLGLALAVVDIWGWKISLRFIYLGGWHREKHSCHKATDL